MQQGNKTMGIISIVLGAFAIVCAYIYMANIAAVIAAIVGIILAVMSKKSFAAAGETSPIPTVGLRWSGSFHHRSGNGCDRCVHLHHLRLHD